MRNLKEGSLVWVKRRNGSWWPGRIMGLDELSPSARLKSSSAKPVRLLGREYSSVDWYNLESGRIKAFRCNEFADFIKNAEGLKASPLKELVKYAHRTDAIIHALELENKPQRKRKMTDCKAEALESKQVCRLKRSRCVYLPVGSRKKSECTSFHAQAPPLPRLVRMAGDPYQSSASENNYSSRSPDTCTFGESAPNGRADETSKQLSGCCSGYPGTRRHKRHEELSGITRDDRILDDVEAPKKKIMLKLKHLNPYKEIPDGFIASGNAIQNDSDPFTVNDAKYQKRTGCSGKQSRKPIRDLYFSSQFEDGGLEISRRQTRSMSSGEPLIDIKLTVETRYEGASVPLVSLMSKVNRKSIIGYPVEVEKLKNGSTEIILPINDNAGNQIKLQSFPRTPACHRPATSLLTPSVRTTARRTSVSYFPAPSPPIKKEFQSLNVPSKNIDLRLVKRENNSLPGEMLQNLPAVVTCVPVKLIFSRLAAAVQLQPEANIHS